MCMCVLQKVWIRTSLSVRMYNTARMYQCCFALRPTYFHVSYIDKCIMMYLSVIILKLKQKNISLKYNLYY